MIYAQFYRREAAHGSIIEACGDNAIVILNGNWSAREKGAIAARECKNRGYAAWRIFKGDACECSAPISQIWYVDYDRPIYNPAWFSAHGM